MKNRARIRRRPPSPAALIGASAFARLVGAHEATVRGAVRSGRLERAVISVRPLRLDVETALREWTENRWT